MTPPKKKNYAEYKKKKKSKGEAKTKKKEKSPENFVPQTVACMKHLENFVYLLFLLFAL